MRALSLWQPHALAVGIGLKPWETRGWPANYRGPVAIHAAERPWTDVGPWHTEARQKLQEYVAKHGPVSWTFGAVVCTADLVSCVRTSELRGRIDPEHEFWGDFTDGEDGGGRYAFKLENVKMLAQPFYCRGMQGWFDVDLGAEERVAPVQVSLQLGLFEFAGPGLTNAQQILAPGCRVDMDAATTPAANVLPDLFDLGVDSANVAQELDQSFFARDSKLRTEDCLAVFGHAVDEPPAAELEVDQDTHAKGIVARRAACEVSREFAEACEAAGFQYRGYAVDRIYEYSAPGQPETIYRMSVSRWDHTAQSLERNAAVSVSEG